MKVPTPNEPEVFPKSMLSLTRPFDHVSRGSDRGVKLDRETERYIFGYVCFNDVSDRSTQVDAQKQQHLVRAKSRATYCPIGSYLTTAIDPIDPDLWTKVKGHYEQQGNTSDMLFHVYEMLAYFSRHMRMVPADISATGTPPGVGMGRNRYMAVRDISECGITNLGGQRHEIVA
jgi:2,4-didehydro-3-deoxy-L-rhamnonate hydrolase